LHNVFSHQGNPIAKSVNNSWRAAMKKFGAGIGMHTMRHCANSWLAERGVSQEVRGVLGGWATGGGAIVGYTHLSVENLRASTEILAEILSTNISTGGQRPSSEIAATG